MIIELQTLGLKVEENKKVEIFYKSKTIGELNLDLVINNSVFIKIDTQKQFIETEK